MCCPIGRQCWFCVMIVVLSATMPAPELTAQQRELEPITGVQQIKPVVPRMDSRPLATQLELRNLRQRQASDNETTGSFISSLQGEDAVIEVIVGRGRLLTFQQPLIKPETETIPAIAVGDPTVLDFDLLPNSQMLRLLGKRVGVTDLSVITDQGKALTFQVQVVYDLNLVRAQLRQLFPNASLNLAQLYEHIVIEGEAENADQVTQIIQTLQALLTSIQIAKNVSSKATRGPDEPQVPETAPPAEGGGAGDQGSGEPSGGEPGSTPALDEEKPDISATIPTPQIINLIRVPGVQQVMLQVRIAELNRTALRQVGADILYRDTSNRTFGSVVGGANFSTNEAGDLLGLALGSATTAFAIIPNASLDVVFQLLRQNEVVNVLAEPNLMAMHGQEASFLAGGEFPVPVPTIGFGGSTAATIEFKEFGVLLNFVPFIMDGDVIRLKVAPEVSTIDPATGVVAGDIFVPGVNSRKANTTVQLRQGQTLALAGLLQAELEARTSRVPGLGDLPYLGPFFSNTTHQRVEKELIILVTPWLVDPMNENQLAPLPGTEIKDPDDFEFYWLNRIEARSNCDTYNPTAAWDDPWNFKQLQIREQRNINGPYGFSK